MSARDKAQALVDEGIEDSFTDAVAALADMGEISQSSADRLISSAVSETEQYVDADIAAAQEDSYATHAAMGDSYDPEEGI